MVVLIHETVAMLRELFQKDHVRIDFTTPMNSLTIRGNRSRLQQVVVNLITNAQDAVVDRSDGRVLIHLFSNLNHVSLEVVDNGTGISPDVVDKIFDPFFTTKGVNKGTGIGLAIAIVNDIIRDHRGSIDVQAEPGKGAKFTVKLPTIGL